ncbi:hypothetical protein CHS0354_014906, partial [Potamilus streckersoni]
MKILKVIHINHTYLPNPPPPNAGSADEGTVNNHAQSRSRCYADRAAFRCDKPLSTESMTPSINDWRRILKKSCCLSEPFGDNCRPHQRQNE